MIKHTEAEQRQWEESGMILHSRNCADVSCFWFESHTVYKRKHISGRERGGRHHLGPEPMDGQVIDGEKRPLVDIVIPAEMNV